MEAQLAGTHTSTSNTDKIIVVNLFARGSCVLLVRLMWFLLIHIPLRVVVCASASAFVFWRLCVIASAGLRGVRDDARW